MKDDYELWKMWWYAVIFGASSCVRMRLVDKKRESKDDAA